MAQEKRLSIDKQLERGWLCLYTIEVDDNVSEELMLAQLEQTAECLAWLRARKRLSLRQREKLANLERWYNAYDLKLLRKVVKDRRKNTAPHHSC